MLLNTFEFAWVKGDRGIMIQATHISMKDKSLRLLTRKVLDGGQLIYIDE